MIRLKEAFEWAKAHGKVKTAKEFAMRVWTGVPAKSAYMNFNNMCTGRVNSITPGLAKAISRELGVSTDYLLGVSDVISEDEIKRLVTDKANEIINIVNFNSN